jgi:hypothetical protein
VEDDKTMRTRKLAIALTAAFFVFGFVIPASAQGQPAAAQVARGKAKQANKHQKARASKGEPGKRGKARADKPRGKKRVVRKERRSKPVVVRRHRHRNGKRRGCGCDRPRRQRCGDDRERPERGRPDRGDDDGWDDGPRGDDEPDAVEPTTDVPRDLY